MTDLPPDWKPVVAQLKRDRVDAKRQIDKLQATLDRMADAMAKQADELTRIRKMLRRREEQLAKAERENRKFRRQLGLEDPEPDPEPDPSGTSAPDPHEGEDADAAEPEPSPDTPDPAGSSQASTEDEDPSEEDAENSSKGSGRKGGRRGPPKHVPPEHEAHEVCSCAACGSAVNKRDVLTTEVYSVVRSYVRRRVIERERVVCRNPACGLATTASMPPMPCERALYDCSFIAWVVTMKFGYMLPLDRIQALLASQGIEIATSSLVHLVERASRLAEAVDGEHMKRLRAGKYLCFDGTGLKVLVPGQNKAWDGYLEVYTRDEETVFQFDMTKHADELRDRLRRMSGILVTDAESRNKAGAPGAVFAHCNAHGVRALRDALKVQPELAKEGLAFLDAFYKLEAEARALGLTGAARLAHRQKGLSTQTEFKDWLRRMASDDLIPTDPIRRFAKFYLRHWEGLMRFMSDGDIPIDNNEAEREFQRHAKLRLASLFAGSVEGAHRWAVLLGVVRTAQKHGLDLQAYLTWMFERRGTHRKRFGLTAADLTPAAYKAAGCPGSLTESVPLAA